MHERSITFAIHLMRGMEGDRLQVVYVGVNLDPSDWQDIDHVERVLNGNSPYPVKLGTVELHAKHFQKEPETVKKARSELDGLKQKSQDADQQAEINKREAEIARFERRKKEADELLSVLKQLNDHEFQLEFRVVLEIQRHDIELVRSPPASKRLSMHTAAAK